MRRTPVSCVALDFGGTIATPGPSPSGQDVANVLRTRFRCAVPPGLVAAVELARIEAVAAYRLTGYQVRWQEILAAATRQTAAQLPDPGAVTAAMWDSVPDAKVDSAAAAAVHRLRQAGFALILACNTQRPLASRRRTLAAAGLDGCFADMVLSSVIGTGKPDPAFYAAVIDAARSAAGCRPDEIVFAGDTVAKDVTGPLRSRMRAVLVGAGPPPAGLPGQVPVIGHLADLPDLLERWP